MSRTTRTRNTEHDFPVGGGSLRDPPPHPATLCLCGCAPAGTEPGSVVSALPGHAYCATLEHARHCRMPCALFVSLPAMRPHPHMGHRRPQVCIIFSLVQQPSSFSSVRPGQHCFASASTCHVVTSRGRRTRARCPTGGEIKDQPRLLGSMALAHSTLTLSTPSGRRSSPRTPPQGLQRRVGLRPDLPHILSQLPSPSYELPMSMLP